MRYTYSYFFVCRSRVEARSGQIDQEVVSQDPKHNLVLIFNDDDGVWEGSWNEANQEAFRRLETAKDVEL